MSNIASIPEWLVIADDLTGAADCVAPIATGRSIPVLVDGAVLPGGTAAVCAPVRDADPAIVQAAFAAALEALDGRRLLIKVDSAGRSPLTAILAALGRRRVLVCPALPSQGRTVLDHQVMVHGRPATRLADHLDVPDVLTEADMAAVVARVLADPELVPVVSSGFTRALAGAVGRAEPSGASQALVVVGTRHPVTLGQLDCLDQSVSVLRSPTSDTGGNPAAVVAAQVPALLTPRSALVVTGGDTALATLEALGADGLSISGELEPGVPVGRVFGGPFAGTAITVKSGGFGTPVTLVRMVAWASGVELA